jgi:hypothetical protein
VKRWSMPSALILPQPTGSKLPVTRHVTTSPRACAGVPRARARVVRVGRGGRGAGRGARDAAGARGARVAQQASDSRCRLQRTPAPPPRESTHAHATHTHDARAMHHQPAAPAAAAALQAAAPGQGLLAAPPGAQSGPAWQPAPP